MQTMEAATNTAAEAVAVAVSNGADYDQAVRKANATLSSHPEYNMTTAMRLSVICQDKVFQLLRMYRQAYEAGQNGAVGFPAAAIEAQPDKNAEWHRRNDAQAMKLQMSQPDILKQNYP